ncbi:NACHT domain-containing protein [Sphingobium olei]|uniref:NACHT domain-containing protein n=1 Tax=Sphingobium olei TaxID=420955 RepID=A0ABW3NZ21_9SPHN
MADVEPSIEIDRRLEREDPTSRVPVIIDQAAILDLDGPVVILGDPGLGKSVLAQAIGRQAGFVYVRAASFVRNAQPERLIPNGECLVIDGLDEIASATVGGGVDAILGQLSKLGYPRFILSSREVDWRGAADRIKIEDDYGQPAILLHLLAFDRDDAALFLRRNFPSVDAEGVLTHLADRGLEEIYKNPLTLRLIGEVAASDEALPNSRAQLLDRACQLLVQEENPRHHDAEHAHAEAEKLLLAAGAYAATQLLCDLAGLFNGPAGKIPDGCVHVGSIAALPHAETIDAALHTRLFEAEGGQRFHLLHRVIAEYLGAKWLARCFQSGVSARRLFSLFGQGHGVPTSLRGLHAWLAYFDDTLAEICVDADPYAVLRYGDAETMPVHVARGLLRALAALSDRDPFFRAEDWGRHPASGLMRVELKDDILALIGTPDQHTHLTLLLVEAMAGSELTAALEPELRAMMFDTARYYGERSRAADALRELGRIDDLAETIERLLAQGGEDDRRLAWEVLHDLGLGTVSMDLAVRTLYAHIGVTVSDLDQNDDRLDLAHLSDSSIEILTSAQLSALLDAARDYGEPLVDNSNHSAKAQVADLVRLAGLRALILDPDMAPADVWRRLHWIDHNQGYKRETTNALTNWFGAHSTVRRAVQTHVVFDAGHEHIRDASFAFYACRLC